jgi:hypothetical protein
MPLIWILFAAAPLHALHAVSSAILAVFGKPSHVRAKVCARRLTKPATVSCDPQAFKPHVTIALDKLRLRIFPAACHIRLVSGSAYLMMRIENDCMEYRAPRGVLERVGSEEC